MPRVIPKTHRAPKDARLALVEAGARIDEAEALDRTLEDLRRDIVQLEQQRDALAALEDRHIEIAQKSFDQRYRIEVEWQPIRSVPTGNALAAEVEATNKPLRAELATAEATISRLLA